MKIQLEFYKKYLDIKNMYLIKSKNLLMNIFSLKLSKI